MNDEEFKAAFLRMMQNRDNPFHPLVWINGDPEIGPGTYIGGLSEINAKGARVVIGANCDIASFVAINCVDSHRSHIGLESTRERLDILIEDNVFIGSHSVILGGTTIGHHSVIGAGTVIKAKTIPPFSLVVGSPARIKPGYYEEAVLKHRKDTNADEGGTG